MATETNSQFIINNSFDGLVSWSEEKGLVSQLAESWIFSPDRKKIRFKLRKATFSDGDQFLPHHVAEHFVRLRKNAYFKDHFDQIKDIKVIDDSHVEMELKGPSPHIMYLLSGSHSRIVKRFQNKIIGIGPFVPKIKGHKVVLIKNKYYWGPKAQVDRIDFFVMDVESAFKAIEKGELDDMILNPGGSEDVDKVKNGNWIEQPMWATWAIAFNRKIIKEEKIRNEIVLSLPSKQFIAMYKGNKEAFGIQSIGMPGYIDKFNLKKLEFARFKTKKMIEIALPLEMPLYDKIENWISSKTLSCCKLVPLKKKFTEIIEQVGKNGFAAYLISFNPEYPDPSFLIRALYSKATSNYIRLSNNEVDELIYQINKTDDLVERATLMRKVNEIIMSEASLVPLMHVVHHALSRKCVEGIQLNPVSEGYFSLRGVKNKCN